MFDFPNPRRFADEGSAVCKKADLRSRFLTPSKAERARNALISKFLGKLCSCALTDAELRNHQTAAFSFMLKF